MGYLILEIAFFLFLATVIGMVVGWIVRGLSKHDDFDRLKLELDTLKAERDKLRANRKT